MNFFWTDEQGYGIERMLAEADDPRAEWRLERGVHHTDADSPPNPELAGDPVLHALDFLIRHKEAYRLEDPQASLFLRRVESEPDEHQVHFGQRFDNQPVHAGGVTVRIRSESVTSVTGKLMKYTAPIDPVEISAWEAEQTVLDVLGGDLEVLGSTELQVWTDVVEPAMGPRWIWRVHVTGLDENEQYLKSRVLVDAYTGRIQDRMLLAQEADRDGENFDIENVNGSPPRGSRGCWNGPFITVDDDWFNEDGENGYEPGDDPSSDGPETEKHLHGVYHVFYDSFVDDGGTHHKSWDRNSGKIQTMLYADVANGQYDPACNQIRLRENYLTDDVYGHEFTHGFLHHEIELGYSFLVGALNESLADMFGEFFDPDDDWLHREYHPDGENRNMRDPPQKGQPDEESELCDAGNPSCCNGKPFTNDTCDNRGVHTNSGVGNKAGYLITKSDLFKGIQVDGIGRAKAKQLYYWVVRKDLSADSDYEDFYQAMITRARDRRTSTTMGSKTRAQPTTIWMAWRTRRTIAAASRIPTSSPTIRGVRECGVTPSNWRISTVCARKRSIRSRSRTRSSIRW